jgi:hypothetical protein
VREEIESSSIHPHYDYIPRKEYRQDIEKIVNKIEKLDDKLTNVLFLNKKKFNLERPEIKNVHR